MKNSNQQHNFLEPLYISGRKELYLHKRGDKHVDPSVAATISFRIEVMLVPTFLDYLGGGMNIQLHYAIDFNHVNENPNEDGTRKSL